MEPIATAVTVSWILEDGSHWGNTYHLPGDWTVPDDFGDAVQSFFFPVSPESGVAREHCEELGGLVEDIDE